MTLVGVGLPTEEQLMKIPIDELQPDTLYAIAESFVLREGTDYGAEELVLAEKVARVIEQLRAGSAILLYSELHETLNIVAADTLPAAEVL